jgi:hypothetical protein
MKSHSSHFLLQGLAVLALIACAIHSALAEPSNKWRIEVSEGAKSDGEIIFYMTPEGGEPFEIRVPIDKGTSENKVARKIHGAFQKALSGDEYNVEVDDGEDVLVKKRSKGVNFELALVSSTVKAVRINLDRE